MNHLILGILFLAILFLVIGKIVSYKKKTLKTSTKSYNQVPEQNLTWAEKQLRHIDKAEFEKRKVMHSGEYILYKRLHGYLQAHYPKYNIFPQVAMGSYLMSHNRKAYFSINSKRTDFLVIDPNGLPIIAIEFQGQGHYQGNAAYRDTIKREALRKADIFFHEIRDGYDEREIYVVGQLIDKIQQSSNTE